MLFVTIPPEIQIRRGFTLALPVRLDAANSHHIILPLQFTEVNESHAICGRGGGYSPAKGKKTAAIYQYQADCDGEWGKIEFDVLRSRAEIKKLADWDTTRSPIYANEVMEYLLNIPVRDLPKKEKAVSSMFLNQNRRCSPRSGDWETVPTSAKSSLQVVLRIRKNHGTESA